MRETVKKVTHEIDGEEATFQIHKMNALEGSFMIKFVAEKLIPLVDGFQTMFEESDEDATVEEVAKKRTENIMDIVPKALASISEEELIGFEKKCLRHVEMLMGAGWQKVMIDNDFGVEEVEYDPLLALMLCFDVVQFNFSGFFGGKGLSSLLNPQSSSKQNA